MPGAFGLNINAENKNYGIRTFGVTDPEGHHWGFMRRIDNERVPIAALP